MTTTVTELLPPTQTLILTSRAPTIGGLVQKMMESSLFSPEMVELICEWEAEVNQMEDSADIAVALHFLLIKIIHPTISASLSNTITVDRLVAFESQVHELIALQLPSGVTVGDYLKYCENKQETSDLIVAFEKLNEEYVAAVTSSANRVNQQIASMFERLKERLLEILDNTENMSETLRQRFEELKSNVDSTLKKAETVETLAKETETRLKAQQASMCEIVKDGVR